jgi:hypothetical protein
MATGSGAVIAMALSDDALEHHGECLTAVHRRVGRPLEDRANLIPDGVPLGTLAIQIEFGQDALDPVTATFFFGAIDFLFS